MRFSGRVILACVATGCASTPQPPPGDELEWPEGTSSERPSRAAFDVAPPSEEALAAAFDAPSPPSAPAAAPRSVPPQATTSPVDSGTDARAAFADRLAQAKRLVTAKRYEEAKTAVDELLQRSATMGPFEVQRAHELLCTLSLKTKDAKTARWAAESWLAACGPERVDRCRAQASRAWTQAAGLSPPSAHSRERIKQVRAADDCVRRAEQTKKASAACWTAAVSLYQRMQDNLMLARAQLAKGMALAGEANRLQEAIAVLTRAERQCQEPRCLPLRRRALQTLANAQLKADDPEGAARTLLAEVRLAAVDLPEEQKPFVRSDKLDRVCARFDERAGAGACRRLEKQLYRDYTFRDFSLERSGQGLSSERVKAVNEHFSVLLQECLAHEAERLVPPASERYDIRWMVTREGRVDQVTMGRKDQQDSPLATCLRQQFKTWRYPRYEGEAQHVEQSFTLNARERRTVGSYHP